MKNSLRARPRLPAAGLPVVDRQAFSGDLGSRNNKNE